MVGGMNWRRRPAFMEKRGWELPLAAALLGGYVLWMGQGMARSGQHDNH